MQDPWPCTIQMSAQMKALRVTQKLCVSWGCDMPSPSWPAGSGEPLHRLVGKRAQDFELSRGGSRDMDIDPGIVTERANAAYLRYRKVRGLVHQ